MATIAIRIESDPAIDAVELLLLAYEHLARRHGEHCRQLEREIEALMHGDGQRLTGAPINLDNTTIIIPASEAVTALLRRARELGLIL